jgi:serine/threonine protein phosphatase 1
MAMLAVVTWVSHLPDAVERVYAIGDVHGRADLLALLLDFIDARTLANPRRIAVVLLGDLVDRGPSSAGVLDLAIGALARWPNSRLCLGNHDDWLRRFLSGAPPMIDDAGLWLEQRGAETLESYATGHDRLGEIRTAILRDRPGHRSLLDAASLLVTWQDFVFAHAGIEPGVPLDHQRMEDALSIRRPFLDHVGPLGAIIVHGHTIQKPARPHVTENRISLDTGAVFRSVLTMVELDAPDATMRFWATGPRGKVESTLPVRVDRGLGTVADQHANTDPSAFALPNKKGRH